MRSLLAVCLSAITMMGAAEAVAVAAAGLVVTGGARGGARMGCTGSGGMASGGGGLAGSGGWPGATCGGVFTASGGETYPFISDVMNSSPTPDSSGDRRTNVMQGAVHLVLFAAFLFLSLVP